METMTYKQAMAYHAKHGGWAHAAAEPLGRVLCIRPEAIYNWAIKHNVSLLEKAKQFIDTPDLLLCCVLNDWTVEHTLGKLKG